MTNYICACWLDNKTRLNKHLKAIKDPYFYVKSQVKFLNFLDHNLDMVTFVVNRDNENFYERIREFIPDKIKDAKVEVWDRENSGMSYGVYNFAYEKYRNQFDYYIFIEDDYVFSQHNFDRHMIRMFKNIPNCGFLCGYVAHPDVPHAKHGGISTGIASSEALEKVRDFHSYLPYDGRRPNFGVLGQIMFTRSFMDVGLELSDVGKEFGIVFQKGNKDFSYYYFNNPVLYLPLQYLETKKARMEKEHGIFVSP